VTSCDQLFRQEFAIDYRTVYFTAGDDLQNVQDPTPLDGLLMKADDPKSDLSRQAQLFAALRTLTAAFVSDSQLENRLILAVTAAWSRPKGSGRVLASESDIWRPTKF
jgi:hypothetical protein